MARPRIASNIHELKGNYKKHPERRNKKEPKVSAKFPTDPPKYLKLTKDEVEMWHEIRNMAPGGVLTGADVVIVAQIARIFNEFRNFTPYQNARGGWVRYYPTERLTRMSSEMAKIGLSPSSRAGLQVNQDGDEEEEF